MRENLSAPVDKHRVLRGGAFQNYDSYVPCACCYGSSQANGLGDDGGFRVAVRPWFLML